MEDETLGQKNKRITEDRILLFAAHHPWACLGAVLPMFSILAMTVLEHKGQTVTRQMMIAIPSLVVMFIGLRLGRPLRDYIESRKTNR